MNTTNTAESSDITPDKITQSLVLVGIILFVVGFGGIFLTIGANTAISLTTTMIGLVGLSLYWSGTMRYQILKWRQKNDERRLKRAVLEIKLAIAGMSCLVLGMALFHLNKYVPAIVWSSILFVGIIFISATTLLQIFRIPED